MRLRRVEGPISGAGLIRYFDTEGRGIKVDPRLVVTLAVFFVLVELILTF